jgi:hypothetical protein
LLVSGVIGISDLTIKKRTHEFVLGQIDMT